MGDNNNRSSFAIGLGIAVIGVLMYMFIQSTQESDIIINATESVVADSTTVIVLNDDDSTKVETTPETINDEPEPISEASADTSAEDVTETVTVEEPQVVAPATIPKSESSEPQPETVQPKSTAADKDAVTETDAQQPEVALEETIVSDPEATESSPATEAEQSTTEVSETDINEVAEQPETEVATATPVDTVEETTETSSATTSSATSAEVVEPLETSEPELEIVLEGNKPEFDLVRVDDTGTAVIAGTAEPNTLVTILSDGEKIGEAIASSSGEFVAIVQTPEKEIGQAIELATEVNGQPLFSDETIFILPTLNFSGSDESTTETAPAIIRASGDGVVIAQSAGMLLLDQISLDSISYDEDGEVILAGRGNPGNGVIVYVDDAAIKETVISESGSWKTVLQDLRAGRYVLRVDEIDSDGKVNSRAESPFQRAFPQEVREAQESGQNTYIVQPGNSLWIIATGKYGEGVQYHQILNANKDQIRDPDLIYPGQVFDIPEAAE